MLEQPVRCPYCDESIVVLIDESIPEQDYIEDCEVCCRPINFHVSVDDDGCLDLSATSENE